jgi:putative DNA primase/helicase
VHSLAGDDPSVCRKYVKEKLKNVFSKPGQSNLGVDDEVQGTTNGKSFAFALNLWGEAGPIEGTPAAVYLTSRRCASSIGMSWPQDLRFHPACPFGALRFPALIGLVRDVVTGDPIGIHRTALSDDGASKRAMPGGLQPKMMLGRASRAAVQLHPAGSVLGIAEGIETALSAQKVFNVPVWGAMSAGGIRSFPLVHGISRLLVFADNDDAGLSAAEACGGRYSTAGVEVEIRYPTIPGSDWNDFVRTK